MTQFRAKDARSRELFSIQYLRGLAALTVLVSHTLQWPLATMSQTLLRSGRLGVEVFFVISGFIITLVGGGGAFDPLGFARRRAWRIVPLYWGATLVVTVMALLLPSLFRTTVPTLAGVLDSLFFIPSEVPKAPLLGVGWTLDYEVFFYLVFVCLAGVTSEIRTLTICLGLGALVAIGQLMSHASDLQYFYTSPSLIGFAAGTLLAQAWRHGLIAHLAVLPRWSLALAPLFLTIAFFIIPASDEAGRAPLSFHLTMSAAAIAIVGAALVLEAAGRLNPHRGLHYLGDASYSVYLFHLFAVGAGWAVAHKLAPHHTVPGYLIAALVISILALASGLAVHQMFERPLLKMGRKAKPVTLSAPATAIPSTA
jgi:exopolysaccharide production protein ExoZ